MDSRAQERSGRPVDDDPPIEPSAVDEYTAAVIRGECESPEVWFRARNRDAPPDPKAVAVLRSVDMLVRHRHALGGSSGRDGRRPALVPGRAGDALIMSDLSEPGPEPADALLDDREWLAAHHFEPLGRLDVPGGGMGFIALAWHTGMKREVVLKVASKESNERRFHREIQVHARLGGHTNIAVTRTPLRYRKASVLVVDYVPGLNFRKRVQLLGPMSWRESCDCIRQAAVGLSHAHHLGITHRDVKSSNLVRSSRDGVVKVIDWGLALDRQAPGEDLTDTGQFLGTPAYCAPEQAVRPSDATPASDLYGLGCVWYELLSGSPPFHGNQAQLATAHRGEPVPALAPGLGVPDAVELIMRQLLEKAPERRFATADEFIEALDRATADRAIDRRLWLAAIAGGLILAGWAYMRISGPSKELAANDLVIDLADTSANPEHSGKLGETTFEARQGDQVTLQAALSGEAYCYLLSFRPDGRVDVWWPADEGTRPSLTAAPRYPASDSKQVIGLDHGVGLQAFALIASREPLPDFRTWVARQDPSPWRAAIPADPGVVWRDDGGQIETLSSLGKNKGRGQGTGSRGARGAVNDLSAWLKSRPGVSVVYIKAFAVQPARP